MSDIHALSGAYAVDALDDDERAAVRAAPRRLPRVPRRGRVASARPPRCSPRPPPRRRRPSLRDRVLSGIGSIRPLPAESRAEAPGRQARRHAGARRCAGVLARGRRGRRWPDPAGAAVARLAAERTTAPSTTSLADQIAAGPRRASRSPSRSPAAATAHRRRARASLKRAVHRRQRRAGAAGAARRTRSGSSSPAEGMVSAGLMPRRRTPTVLLTGDAATADGRRGLASSPRPARPSRRPTRSPCSRSTPRAGTGVMTRPRRIAVIGSGVAGLTAAYVAARTAHVTLYEADDRLGGHADTHDVATALADRHRLHRAQRAHLPDAAAALRRARRARRSPRRCRCRSATTATGLEYAGALGLRGLFPTGRNLRRPALPADAGRDPAVPPPGPGAARAAAGRPGPDAARLPRRRRVLGVLPPPLHGAARRRGVVVRPGGRARLPRALPVRRSSTTTGCSAVTGSPAVADRDRRLARVRRARSPPASTRSALGTKVTSVRETADGVEVTDGNGVDHAVRRRRDRHPPRPGAGHAGRADRRAARRARRDARTPTTLALLHTDTSLLPARRRTPGRRGTSCARAATAARSR